MLTFIHTDTCKHILHCLVRDARNKVCNQALDGSMYCKLEKDNLPLQCLSLAKSVNK